MLNCTNTGNVGRVATFWWLQSAKGCETSVWDRTRRLSPPSLLTERLLWTPPPPAACQPIQNLAASRLPDRAAAASRWQKINNPTCRPIAAVCAEVRAKRPECRWQRWERCARWRRSCRVLFLLPPQLSGRVWAVPAGPGVFSLGEARGTQLRTVPRGKSLLPVGTVPSYRLYLLRYLSLTVKQKIMKISTRTVAFHTVAKYCAKNERWKI